MPLVTIRDLLSHVLQGNSGVYRLHARVSRSLPSPANMDKALVPLDIIRLPDSEISSQAKACGHTFGLKFLLEDPTGEIDAILVGEDGENFFGQLVPPFNPKKSKRSTESSLQLQQWMEWLTASSTLGLGGGASTLGEALGDSLAAGEGCRWLDVCVKTTSMDMDPSRGLLWTIQPVRIVQTTLKAP